jgi:hypothetical protein
MLSRLAWLVCTSLCNAESIVSAGFASQGGAAPIIPTPQSWTTASLALGNLILPHTPRPERHICNRGGGGLRRTLTRQGLGSRWPSPQQDRARGCHHPGRVWLLPVDAESPWPNGEKTRATVRVHRTALLSFCSCQWLNVFQKC